MGKMQISGRFVGDAYMRPVRFSRCIVISGTAATGGIYAAPTNQPVMFIIIYGRGRGVPRPYRAVYFYCPVGRGDPTPPQKPSPWGEGGALARRMRGKCPGVTPSSVTCGDSFPQRGKPPCGMTHTGISRGLSKAPPGLCLAQRCAALFDSSYGNKKSSSS